MDPFEIYFADLNKETQEAYLEFAGLNSAEEANLNVCPLVTIETPEPEPISPSAPSICASVKTNPRYDRDVR